MSSIETTKKRINRTFKPEKGRQVTVARIPATLVTIGDHSTVQIDYDVAVRVQHIVTQALKRLKEDKILIGYSEALKWLKENE